MHTDPRVAQRRRGLLNGDHARNDVTVRIAIDGVGVPPDGAAVRWRLMFDPSDRWEDAAVTRGYEMRQTRLPFK